MKRASLIVGLLVGLLALGSAGFTYADASAQGTVETPKPVRDRAYQRQGATIKGEVVAIEGDALTVQTEQRGAVTVEITGGTRFRAQGRRDFTQSAASHFSSSKPMR